MTSEYLDRRIKMVDGQLRTTDVNEPALVEAMLSVPREEFVPRALRALAYIDEDIRVNAAGGEPRFLMEPSPFARLVKLAAPRRGDVVLDVGCATGYSAAVLSQLASSVVALEADPVLVETATETLSRLGYDNVAVVAGALNEGCPQEAPYDVILLGGSVDFVPDALLDQLREGGRLVAVVGHGNSGFARLFVRSPSGVSSTRAFNAAIRPLPGFARAAEFSF